MTGFVPQTLQNIADAQHANGAVPTTAPEYVVFEGLGMDAFAESPEWGCTFVVLPFMYYETYGDDSLIRKYYNGMRRYIDYMTTRANDGIVSFGLGDWYDYGDFRAGFSRNTPVPLVATAHYYMVVRYLVEAARMLDNRYDVAYYTHWVKKLIKHSIGSFIIRILVSMVREVSAVMPCRCFSEWFLPKINRRYLITW